MYNEEVEIQHCTIKDTMNVAERFLYKTPHTEQDAITHTVKKLWHVNNPYAYQQRQAEKKKPPPSPPTSPQPQQTLIPRPSPVQQIRNFPTAAAARSPIAENRPFAENRPSVSTSPILHSSQQFLIQRQHQQLEQAQRAAHKNYRREQELRQGQLRYYKERIQTVKEKEKAA